MIRAKKYNNNSTMDTTQESIDQANQKKKR